VSNQKYILIIRAGGFIGHHLVKRLRYCGHWVRGAEIELPESGATESSISLEMGRDTKYKEIERELTEAGRLNPLHTGQCRC
jgi:nucleoside-diphosphate-sugar epimerase